MSDYGSRASKKHVRSLQALGFTVIDPSSKEHSDKILEMKNQGKTSKDIMDYFVSVVEQCDHLAFRALSDGTISAGVGKEIRVMRKKGGQIIEMPNPKRKVLSITATRQHLKAMRFIKEWKNGKEEEKERV
jgi:hypothetical protein